MQRFGGAVRDTSGNALAGVTVTVFKSGTAVAATLYSDNSYSALANPFTNNVDGTWRFYAAPGRYDVQYVKTGYAFGTAPTYDQLSYDYMSVITPAALSASVNNYAPPNGLNVEQWRLSGTASWSITGIDATTAVSGQTLSIFNVGTFSILIPELSGSSSANNQIVTGAGTVTLQPGQAVLLKYDSTSLKWRTMTSPASLTSATALVETGGPTTLTVGAVADGQVLRRSAATIVGLTPIFTSEFISADQAIGVSSALSVAHGLGAKPKLWQVTVKCTTAEQGYSIGDEILIGDLSTDNGNNGVNSAVDATNVVIVTGSVGPALRHKSGFNAVALTAANWRYVVRAWK